MGRAIGSKVGGVSVAGIRDMTAVDKRYFKPLKDSATHETSFPNSNRKGKYNLLLNHLLHVYLRLSSRWAPLSLFNDGTNDNNDNHPKPSTPSRDKQRRRMAIKTTTL